MFKKLYFKFELIRHYWRRYYLFVIIGTLIGSLLAYFSRPIAGFIVQVLPQKSATVGVAGLYTVSNLPPEISRKISYGLMVQSNNNRPEPSALTKSYDVSSDGLTYTFELNPNIWQNGQPLQSSDLASIYTINNATVSTPSPNTLAITLKRPFSPLLSVLTSPIFQNNQLVGVGEHKVIQSQFQDGYLRQLVLSQTNNSKSTTTYRFYPSENDLVTAFKLGEIDNFSTIVEPKDIINWKNTQIQKVIDTNSRYVALFFNTEKLNRKQYRQALSYATPKPRDKSERCLGPISPESWAFNPQTKEYNFNPTRAKELSDSEDPKTLGLTVASRELLPLAEEIKKSWWDILKISVEINTQPSSAQDFDVLLSYGNIPPDPDQYAFWHSTQIKTNRTRLNNPRIDKLLEEGRQTMDYLQRKQIYFDFQKNLLEEAPAVFIKFPVYHLVSRLQ